MIRRFPVTSSRLSSLDGCFLTKVRLGEHLDFDIAVPQDMKNCDGEGLINLSSETTGLGIDIRLRSLIRDLHAADLIQAELEGQDAQILETRIIDSPSGEST